MNVMTLRDVGGILLRMMFRLMVVAAMTTWAFAAQATTYPLTVTDMAGRTVTIKKNPQHVIMQDGRNALITALLDRDDPFIRIVAWNNILRFGDHGLWQRIQQQWPDANKIMDMHFNDSGQLNLEEVMTRNPDLLIAELRAKPALEQGGVLKMVKKLDIPVLFVDTVIDPVKNAPKSVALLGKVFDQEANAKEYTDFYQQRLAKIQNGVKAALAKPNTHKPTVFVEAHAGAKGANDCCFTHAHFGWGALIEAAGGDNVGLKVLKSPSGVIAMEKVLEQQPDIYVMTGSQWNSRAQSISVPLGFDVTQQQVDSAFEHLLSRPGFDQLKAYKNHRIYAIYHQFYNHAYNIIGIEALAKDMYPEQFKDLDPNADYKAIFTRMTSIKPTGDLTLVAHAK